MRNHCNNFILVFPLFSFERIRGNSLTWEFIQIQAESQSMSSLTLNKLNPLDSGRVKKKNSDAFEKQIEKHNWSKTDEFLNLIYSLFVGIISGVLTGKHIKYGRTIGLVMGLVSYTLSKKASKAKLNEEQLKD